MHRGFRRIIRGISVVFILLFISFLAFRNKYNEDIRGLAQTQVKNVTSDLINDAIDRQIETGNVQYDRIVYFEKDLNGRVTALKTNMSEINRLKTDILDVVNEEILALDTSDIGIPTGSLFLPELFSGKGPIIPVQILAIRNSEAEFSSHFTEAGINQTLHKIIMHISVDAAVLILGETAHFTISAQVVIAETIIVGHVPDTLFTSEGKYDR